MSDEKEVLEELIASIPPTPVKKLIGFARLTPEERFAISSKGGKKAHANGTAHKFTREEAREAGRKGGSVRGPSKARPGVRVSKPSAPVTDGRGQKTYCARCKLCLLPCHDWQEFCGAACCAQWEAGKRP